MALGRAYKTGVSGTATWLAARRHHESGLN